MFILLFSMIATNPHFLMEGEEDEMTLKKKVGYITASILIFCLQAYILFWETNYLPFYQLSMYGFLIVDQFINYSKDIKFVYVLGLFAPKSLLILYIFYFPDTLHMGPTNPQELLYVGAGAAVILCIVLVQVLGHPRFYLRTAYEKELLKLIPKSMLVEDLL